MYYSNYNDHRFQDEQPIESVHYQVHDAQPPRKEKKKHLGVKIVAACLACTLAGGAAGGGIATLLTRGGGMPQTAPSTPSDTTVYESVHDDNRVNVNQIKSGQTLSISEIYAANVGSSVGIVTELVTRNWLGQQVPSAAAGSGFVVSSDGYIVTNYHVVSSAHSIKVTFSDGTSYDAQYMDGDADSDIAVLKIDASGLTPVKLGDSDNLNVGEQVAAIGNPLGELTFTLTSGYISALNRALTMSDGTVMNMIQTDTAINNGNSGGPLFNTYGELIGITTAKLSSSNTSSTAGIEGLGFAIPINDVKAMILDIVANGRITGRAYMGLNRPATVTESTAQMYGMSVGVYVNQVEPGSAADRAGLQRGDIITAIGSNKITSTSALQSVLKKYQAGQTESLTVDRSGQTIQLEITFDEKPAVETSTQSQSNVPAYNDNYDNGNGYGFYWPFG